MLRILRIGERWQQLFGASAKQGVSTCGNAGSDCLSGDTDSNTPLLTYLGGGAMQGESLRAVCHSWQSDTTGSKPFVCK